MLIELGNLIKDLSKKEIIDEIKETLSNEPNVLSAEDLRSLKKNLDLKKIFSKLENKLIDLKKSLVSLQKATILLFEKEYDIDEDTVEFTNIMEKGNTKEESELKMEKLNAIITKNGTDKLNAIIDYINYEKGEK